MIVIVFVIVFVTAIVTISVYASRTASLTNPVVSFQRNRSRNFVAAQDGVWSGGTSSTYLKETCPHCLNRGGVLAQCGMLDGRNYDDNLSILGEPMPPAPQAQYSAGQEIDVEVLLTAHHKGHFEFFACPIAPGEKPTESCFKQYPLTFVSDPLYGAPMDASYPTRAYIAPLNFATTDNSFEVPGVLYRFRLKLPSNLSGNLVLLQWYYLSANSCTFPGYSSYPFPSSWGNMQDGLPECTSIPPDGNGYPGTCE
jgi:Lytic polysaccharide mono-oxygenase, cellulose-degrading